MSGVRGWIGVDLDGTVATYNGWYGEGFIGAPIPSVVERIKAILQDGRVDVKIFTARVSGDDPEEVRLVEQAVKDWCKKHIGQELEVTCKKDYAMIELWDDRAKQVIPNTGIFLEELLEQAQANANH